MTKGRLKSATSDINKYASLTNVKDTLNHGKLRLNNFLEDSELLVLTDDDALNLSKYQCDINL